MTTTVKVSDSTVDHISISRLRGGELVTIPISGAASMPDVALEKRVARAGSLEVPTSGRVDFRVAQRNCPPAGAGVDRALIDGVGQALCAAGHPALCDIHVEIGLGGVLLAGQVHSYYLKQLAQEIAQRVDGVRGIVNGVKVGGGRSPGNRSFEPSSAGPSHPRK